MLTNKLLERLGGLRRNDFIRGVVAVASGTAAAQVIAMLAAPLVTRFFGPDAFGQLGVFNSIVNVIAPAAALAFPVAIVLPSRDRDAGQLVKLSLVIAASVSAILGFVLLLFGDQVVRVLSLEAIRPVLFLVPLTVFFVSAQQVAQQWLIRKRLFAATGRANVYQAVAVSLGQVVAGLVQPVGAALVWVSSVGKLLHAALLSLAGSEVRQAALPQAELPPVSMRELALRYRDFALFRAPQELVTAGTSHLPAIILVAFLNPAAVGLFTLCQSVLGVPSRLIGTSVGSVFYPRVAEAAKQGEDVGRLLVRTTLALFMVGVLPYLTVVLFGPQLFAFVFGSEWREAGEFARWLALVHFTTMLTRPAVQVTPVLAAQRFALFHSVISLSLRLGGLLFGVTRLGGAVHGIALYSLVGVLAHATMFLALLMFSKRFDHEASEERFR